MSGLTASTRKSNTTEAPSHNSHSQVRQFHTGPTSSQQQPTFDFPSPQVALSNATETPAENPSAAGGYFNFVNDDPGLGNHSTKNWSPASSSIRSAAARSPLPVLVDNPTTPFQIQTEVLARKLQRKDAPRLDLGSIRSNHTTAFAPASNTVPNLDTLTPQGNDYFSSVRDSSPDRIDIGDNDPWPPLSAPPSLRATPALPSPISMKLPAARSMTLPIPAKDNNTNMIEPAQLSELITQHNTDSLLLLDVRTYKNYSEARIKSAVNLCIPTTLLKRPSFNVTKLSETFANNQDKERFGQWKKMKFIVVYDADSNNLNDSSALTALHTLNKFSREGWDGLPYILKGGFSGFAAIFDNQVDRTPPPKATTPVKGGLSLNGASGPEKVTGGVFNCPLPQSQSVVNPFFSNIRQNMDLIDGVGEIPIQVPTTMSNKNLSQLPTWLNDVACKEDGSKVVADRFLKIEKAEQRRMQDALNVSVVYDSPTSASVRPHTLAGVEKGNKNRYNNIWPYDHSRVKLQEYPTDECDYVNASHISVPHSQKRYIASQAPLPSTFRDFWSMIWEQDVRVIVMLTAESEGGRLKSHNYWNSDQYGSLKLTRIQERKVSLEPPALKASPKRRSVSCSSSQVANDIPYITVRKFTLEHTGCPFMPMREITQLQYTGWPDLGAPAHPSHVLGLVEHTDAVVRASSTSSEHPSRRPVLVHCSAGCGRTGTFCTVDSVIGMMKRQMMHKRMLAKASGANGSAASSAASSAHSNYAPSVSPGSIAPATINGSSQTNGSVNGSSQPNGSATNGTASAPLAHPGAVNGASGILSPNATTAALAQNSGPFFPMTSTNHTTTAGASNSPFFSAAPAPQSSTTPFFSPTGVVNHQSAISALPPPSASQGFQLNLPGALSPSQQASQQASQASQASHLPETSDHGLNLGMGMGTLGLEDDGDWIGREDEDLVYKAVCELRDQRISMVQCLQQYVLCYETVLEWLAKEQSSGEMGGKRKA
ncbi:Similar to Tyrosine-protein phosphatase non-receptor type 1; acc. no. O13016 [Pyronema omphalodes CBS 100304]|uniref:protein-tyrosine-phosphatase n=1 Tax=Pyronema omphalodes (strain CBS 100304) TaxID=1076935 RepID=U4LQG1_PYROM|nr:Similar to Tyrosine-protein phosphatase non-receptor type 1; acc. no. O13016 [Pyronema omphalodes CBS 100304]